MTQAAGDVGQTLKARCSPIGDLLLHFLSDTRTFSSLGTTGGFSGSEASIGRASWKYGVSITTGRVLPLVSFGSSGPGVLRLEFALNSIFGWLAVHSSGALEMFLGVTKSLPRLVNRRFSLLCENMTSKI